MEIIHSIKTNAADIRAAAFYEATENEEEREITILFKALMFCVCVCRFFFFVLKYSGEEQILLRDIPFLV